MTLTTHPDAPATTMPTVVGFHHLGLTVRDIETSEAWYSRVLGMVRAFVEPHPAGGGHTVVMTRPGTSLFLGLDHHPQADRERFDARRTGLDHVALRVNDRSDLDAWTTHLDTLGVAHGPVEDKDEPPHAAMVVPDPDGIPVELFWSAS
ncbi:VOC family protein [Segeticoccus rhizosphaerae]|uniref:VOC family protein n=1 Tax=Segeticoccus rhizosphaerae TaxID=1104777 RepID=UPI0010BF8E69|nr:MULTISPECIES: VOC family protein [Intrasporangiaceae]